MHVFEQSRVLHLSLMQRHEIGDDDMTADNSPFVACHAAQSHEFGYNVFMGFICRATGRPATSPTASYKMRMEANTKALVYDEVLDAPNAGLTTVMPMCVLLHSTCGLLLQMAGRRSEPKLVTCQLHTIK